MPEKKRAQGGNPSYTRRDLLQPMPSPATERSKFATPRDDDSNRLFMSEPSASEVESPARNYANHLSGVAGYSIDEGEHLLPPHPVRNRTQNYTNGAMSPGNTSLSSWESPHVGRVKFHFSPDRPLRKQPSGDDRREHAPPRQLMKVDSGQGPKLVVVPTSNVSVDRATNTDSSATGKNSPLPTNYPRAAIGGPSDHHHSTASSSSVVSPGQQQRLNHFLTDLRESSTGNFHETTFDATASFESSCQGPQRPNVNSIYRSMPPQAYTNFAQNDQPNHNHGDGASPIASDMITFPVLTQSSLFDRGDDTVVMTLSASEDERDSILEPRTRQQNGPSNGLKNDSGADDEKTADRPRRVRRRNPSHRRQRSGDEAAATFISGNLEWKGMELDRIPLPSMQGDTDDDDSKRSDPPPPIRSNREAPAKESISNSPYAKGPENDSAASDDAALEGLRLTQRSNRRTKRDAKPRYRRGLASGARPPQRSTPNLSVSTALDNPSQNTLGGPPKLPPLDVRTTIQSSLPYSTNYSPLATPPSIPNEAQLKSPRGESAFDSEDSLSSNVENDRQPPLVPTPPLPPPPPSQPPMSQMPQMQPLQFMPHMPPPISPRSQFIAQVQGQWSGSARGSTRKMGPGQPLRNDSPRSLSDVSATNFDSNGRAMMYSGPIPAYSPVAQPQWAHNSWSSGDSQFSWLSRKNMANGDPTVLQSPVVTDSTVSPRWSQQSMNAIGVQPHGVSPIPIGVESDSAARNFLGDPEEAFQRQGSPHVAFPPPGIAPNRTGSPFAVLRKPFVESDRRRFRPSTSTLEHDVGTHPTYICPRCKTPQREFFTVSSAPRQFESAAGYIAFYFGVYVIAALYIFGLQEGWPALDCIYFAVITLTTAGLGDLVPTSDGAKIMCSVFIYFGVACIGLLLGSYIAGMLDESSRREAKANRINACPTCTRIQTIRDVAAHKHLQHQIFHPQETSPFHRDPSMYCSERHFDDPAIVEPHHKKQRQDEMHGPIRHFSERSSVSHDLTESLGSPHSWSSHHADTSNVTNMKFETKGGDPSANTKSTIDGSDPPTPKSAAPASSSTSHLGSPLTAQILGRQSHTRHESLDLTSKRMSNSLGATWRQRKFSVELPATLEEANSAFENAEDIKTPLFAQQTYSMRSRASSSQKQRRSNPQNPSVLDDCAISIESSSSSTTDTEVDLDEKYNAVKNAKYVFLTLQEALLNSMLIIAFGCLGFYFIEGFTVVDSWYFTTVLLTTVGYGDITPVTKGGKLFATVYILVAGTILLNNMSLISMIPLELRKRRIEQAVLTQFGNQLDDAALRELATGPLIQRLNLSAQRPGGLDECTREMFSLAMLVRLGKVTEDDIRCTFSAFRKLDVNKDGVLNSKSIIAGMIHKRRTECMAAQQQQAMDAYFQQQQQQRQQQQQQQQQQHTPARNWFPRTPSFANMYGATANLQQFNTHTMAPTEESSLRPGGVPIPVAYSTMQQ